MVLLRTSYMYGGFLGYYFRQQFSAFWSMYDKTSSWGNANFKMYPSLQKTELSPEKKIPPPPVTTTPSKNSITITETISNTQTKSQPLPEKSQPFVKNSQSVLKKSQPPKNFFNPP